MTRALRSWAGLFLTASLSTIACSSAPADDGADGDSQGSAWDAESVTDEKDNTHLWIVNRALDILALHKDLEPAAQAVAEMNEPACRKQWQQGLFDADFLHQYNQGKTDLEAHPGTVEVALSKASWESHFYDADSQKNYKGSTTLTARTQANQFVSDAFSRDFSWNATQGSNVKAGERDKACYSIGLALHYFTDMTQPMHAVNYTALSRPLGLHSNLEGYAVQLQSRFKLNDWAGLPKETSMDAVLVSAARLSKDKLFPEGTKAVINAYNTAHKTSSFRCQRLDLNLLPTKFGFDLDRLRIFESQEKDEPLCWKTTTGEEGGPPNQEIIKTVGESLTTAQDATARYLFLAGKRMGEASSR